MAEKSEEELNRIIQQELINEKITLLGNVLDDLMTNDMIDRTNPNIQSATTELKNTIDHLKIYAGQDKEDGE